MDRETGQASTEYVAVVALVAVVLAAAGAVAVPGLPASLARTVRMGLCIVGGDVCRAADARRLGLEPCVVRVDARRSRMEASIAVVKFGSDRALTIERRSDGTLRVMAADGDDAGLGSGVGVRLGTHVSAGAEAKAMLGFTSGAAWELPDEAALRRFLADARKRAGPARGAIPAGVVDLRAWPPTERFHGGTGRLGAGAGIDVLGLQESLGSAGARGVLGRRRRGSRTTWYADASHVGPSLFGDLIPEVALSPGGAWVIELSDRPRELRIRTSLPAQAGTAIELDARLDLTVPENAAVVRDLLARPSRARARAIGRHVAQAGVVERRRYRVRQVQGDQDVSFSLGLAGVSYEDGGEVRTLEGAELLQAGRSARRADCLGLDA